MLSLKTKGIEIEVRDNSNHYLGDLYVTKASLTWCKGQTTKAHGDKITWDEFIKYIHPEG